MTTEQLIAKGVKHHFNGQESVFELESLNEHFDGLQIHESDILELSLPALLPYEDFISVKFVKERDVNFESAVAKEVAPKVEEIEHVVTAITPAPKKKRVTKPKQ
jgi:hypothetical protein